MIRVARMTALAAALAFGVPTVALAQAPAPGGELKGPSVGATVYDPQGGVAGTIEAIDGANVTFSTDKHKLAIPLDRFGKSANGPTIMATMAQLDQMVEQAQAEQAAKVQAMVQPGAQVYGSAGGVLGSVVESDGQLVTLNSAAGGQVRVPMNGFTAGANGLTLNMTADQFAATVAAAKQ